MGILMRTYIFICVFGVVSMISIVFMTYSSKSTHHSVQVSDRTLWQNHWKTYSLQKNHRDVGARIEEIKKINLPAEFREKTDIQDAEDDNFSVKLFSDGDRRPNRNTASVRDSLDGSSKDFPSDSKWGVSRPEKVPSLFKEVERTADKLFGTPLEHLSEEEREKTKDEETNGAVTEAPTRYLRKNTSRVVFKEQPVLNNSKATSSKATAEHRHLVIAEARDRLSALRKKYNETPKYSQHFTKKKLDAVNRTSHIREAEQAYLSRHKHNTKGETANVRQPAPLRRKPVSKKISRTLEQPNGIGGVEFKVGRNRQPILVSRQVMNRSAVLSYPKYIRSNATLSRVLPLGNLSAGRCKPLNNFAMMKTHKCSSSTLQNILYRWGDDHNLTFILPKDGVYLGHPEPFNIEYAQRVPGDRYNILANHARYDEGGLKKVLPSDTIYITILRDPVKQFESAFTYYKFDERYGVSGLRGFLQQPEVYFQSEPVYPRQAGRNQMLYDLGLDARFMDETSHEVQKYIAMIESNFQLVMIAEYFEESLILLKDLFCWSVDDIVYFNQNARSKASVRRVTGSMRREILDWNSADNFLYNHFNRTLWAKIERFGVDRMKEEIKELQLRNDILKKKCIGGKLESHDPRMWYPEGIKVNSFVMNPNALGDHLCEQLIRPELSYISILRAKQWSTAVSLDRKNYTRRKRSRHIPWRVVELDPKKKTG
ncbi:uncharacterized protein [Asterias amurensis]|uniref:uncharacterized protein n=1 Tax=Asterias amurensis TaxID=7602 RepID=UPI003AB61B40